MSVYFDEERSVFCLMTENTSYMIGIADGKYVGHAYYGARMEDCGCGYLLRTDERPEPPSRNIREKAAFADSFFYEYSTWGVGDYRDSCLRVRTEGGARACELVFDGYRILDGKPELPGLPSTFAGEAGSAQTLEIVCRDDCLKLKVILRYSIFEDSDALIRSVELVNEGGERLYLEKVLSACLDMDNNEFQMLTLTGSWARERHMGYQKVSRGYQGVGTTRGISSHQEHPFIALVTENITETTGEVYAMNFVYSGNFKADVELSQFDTVRMTMGIHPDGFEWVLEPGASFTAPEVVCVYSDSGLGQMTRTFHDLYRNHLIRSRWLHEKRPVLINNWEATYFDFDTERLLEIASEAAKDGVEMLVMDDGWFGRRNDDTCSLGDWSVNEKKLPGGLAYLSRRLKEMGMRFGIWLEPEMVSPDSDLYRSHPDWAVHVPGREGTLSRSQYILDLSRPEVVDYVSESVARVLRSADISYVKWDMNRQMTEVGSACLDSACQGELYHRYVLGVYELQSRLLREFPELLLENCTSGGGRFDPGMLYYSPQIWCSDDTDAMERLAIQEGTALLYPLSTIGAHVSICPNHIVGRVTPFETRGYVALGGTFGYELDIMRLSGEERGQMRQQIELYHKYQSLVREGDYYRLASARENHEYDCYMVVSKDRREALVTYIQVRARANFHSRRIRLAGLAEDTCYVLEETGRQYSGRLLMKGGILAAPMAGDYTGKLYHFSAVS
ncbi:MAG: alpha-galactosidase [Lachnospiraceae bacterium]|jgi:alpha-galactosidase|nr:alpha-galactosidase [Lachnospiraceae bacterium]